MIRSLYIAVVEGRRNRGRRRRIATMRKREKEAASAEVGVVQAMAVQLAEIRELPEALERRP